MKLYFVRHGESEANLLHEISNRGFKHGLTERGFQQAAHLAQKLSLMSFGRIYTSPLKRAFQTADILQQHLNCHLEITDALREFDCGVLEGKSDPESWAIFDQVFNQWLVGHWEDRIPGGESHLDIQARFIPLIEELTQTPDNTNVLLVGHGGTYLSMLPLILENIDFEFARTAPIEHTAPIIVEVHTSGMVCCQWGDIELDEV